MIYQWIYQAYGAGGLLAVTLVFGLALYALLAGTSYGLFFVWGRGRFLPDYQPERTEMFESVK